MPLSFDFIALTSPDFPLSLFFLFRSRNEVLG